MTTDFKKLRDQFHFPKSPTGAKTIYLCGNSLGLQPKGVKAAIEQELKDWADLGVEGHFHAKNPWLPYHEFVTEPLARVVGAKPIEVVAMNSLTVNLHLLMISFYRPTKNRFKIIIEGGAFPSDRYAVQSQIRLHAERLGFSAEAAFVEILPNPGRDCLTDTQILEAIAREGDSLALILMGNVNYLTGQAFDMRAIAKAGHAVGALVGFDLAHGAGNLHLQLHDDDVDFAAWCSYKYLNSGPGGIAGIFVHERHSRAFDLPRFWGWWSHDKSIRFQMGPHYVPMVGAEGWQLSNPPIFQLAALKASLELFDQVGMKALRARGDELTSALEKKLLEKFSERLEVITPKTARGSQLSIRIKNADGPKTKKALSDLLERGVYADFREPNLIRVAPAPLYNSFEDGDAFVELLGQTLKGLSS